MKQTPQAFLGHSLISNLTLNKVDRETSVDSYVPNTNLFLKCQITSVVIFYKKTKLFSY
jgi:hypothetical protein